MDLTTGYSMSMPIFQADLCGSQLVSNPATLLGTCFALGGDYAITAGHVTATAANDESKALVMGVYDAYSTEFYPVRVIQTETLNCDVSILQLEFEAQEVSDWYNRFKWSTTLLNPFTDVRSIGYAYGVQHVGDRKFTIVRGFKGYIVATLNQFAPVGTSGAPFEAYELSFTTPRGLSGSPLFNSANRPTISGLVIGNSQSRMTVFREEERVETSNERTIVEQYEMLTLGIAVPARAILSQSSQLLGSTVMDHLNEHELVAQD